MITQTKIVKLILPSETLLMTLYNKSLIIQEQTYYASYLIGDIDMQFSASLQADTAFISMIKMFSRQFNGAVLEIYDYDLTLQQIILPACFIGKVMETEIYDTIVTLKAYSSKQLLNRIITRTYDKQCQAEWGDNRCHINKELYKQQIQITNINNNNDTEYIVLNGIVNNFYNPYLVDSLGTVITVLNHNSVLKKFKCESFYTVQIGQVYSLYAGCQKDILNCNYYNNIKNYLGFNN